MADGSVPHLVIFPYSPSILYQDDGLVRVRQVHHLLKLTVGRTERFLIGLRILGTSLVPSSSRMTYCLEHPTRKLLLMPVKPFEPNKSFYVYSETPLLLDVNTKATKLREVIDKIIKIKLGMNLPLVMIGSTLVFEDGDGLEEDEAANCALNLENVLVELPAPIINGTKLTVEDLRQELSCSINIKHREEFDKEKEPDRMVLYGWSAPVEEQINSNGEKKPTASSSCAHVTDNTTGIHRVNLG